MRIKVLYNIVIILFVTNIEYTSSGSNYRSLSRKKRYVVFPEGSSLTVAFCITMNLIDMPSGIITELINFGINYDLPNNTATLLGKTGETKEVIGRRYRRELYNKVEIILNAIGLEGKTCIYRTLCEAAQLMKTNGNNLMEEIIRRLFNFPLLHLHEFEPEEHKEYHNAHKRGFNVPNCSQLFPDCHVSLIDLLLGYKKIGLK